MRRKKKNIVNKKGFGRKAFTLVELMFASAIMIVTVTGILMSYLRCLELNEMTKNSALALKAATTRMETVKSTAFDQIKATYHNAAFGVVGLNGMGNIYVDDSVSDFLQVSVSISWRLRNGRLYGEDTDLDGALDVGEDSNGNGMLDAPVQLVSGVFEK